MAARPEIGERRAAPSGGRAADGSPVRHFRRAVERPVARCERDRVTFLWGGLTARHEALVTAGMEALGYRVGVVPVPTKADFQTGKECCSPGMCNPAYFTIGALINYLRGLRDVEGLTAAEIVRRYAFFTAGSLGPCRFGMYEAGYRRALRRSGFDGFRVLAFQQKGGLSQFDEGAAVDLNAQFMATMLNGLLIGDVLNELAHLIRPYETKPGQTDRVFARVVDRLGQRFCARDPKALKGRALARVAAFLAPGLDAGQAAPAVDQLVDDYYVETLRECAAIIDDEIEVDFTRPKPIVKVTGEFWAQMTEGAGNYGMFRHLESEGAEVLVEPLTTWVNYLCDVARCRLADRRGLEPLGSLAAHWALVDRARSELGFWKGRLAIGLLSWALNREYNRIREALGGTTHEQVDQAELRRLAEPFFDSRASGGEGHLEIGKTIYYATRNLAHLVLSLKPFGCLPSTQSDGAQAAVLARYPGIRFASVETSGEGGLAAYSRVELALAEARGACRREFATTLARTGYGLADIREYCAAHRALRRPLQRIARYDGVCGRAARFVRYVARQMDEDRAWQARKPAPRAV